ncbi:MAG: hypothetical protein ACPGVV_07340 [Croceimicrobium sp.]
MYQPQNLFAPKSLKPHLLLCLAFLLSMPLAAQRDLSFKQLFQEIANTKEGEYVLKNATVRFNPATDQFALKPNLDTTLIPVSIKVSLSNIQFIGPELNLNHWKMPETYISGFNFQKGLAIEGSSGAIPEIVNVEAESVLIARCQVNAIHMSGVKAGWLSIDNNRVEAQIRVVNGNFGKAEWSSINNNSAISLLIDSCSFGGVFYIQNNSIIPRSNLSKPLDYGFSKGTIKIGSSTFLEDFNPANNISRNFEVLKSNFKGNAHFSGLRPTDMLAIKLNHFENLCTVNKISTIKIEIGANHFKPSSSLVSDQLQIKEVNLKGDFFINNNTFENLNRKFGVGVQFVNTDYLIIDDNEFKAPLKLSALNVRSRLAIADNTFEEPVLFHSISYGIQSFINWEKLKGVIVGGSSMEKMLSTPIDSLAYRGNRKSSLLDENAYKRLLQVYSELRNLYRTQGNLADANELEVLLGDLRLRRYRLDYKANPRLETYFNWKVNNFMRVFTAYGTNPILAILYSLRIIFIFALFYMLFHNQWDINTQGKLASRLRLILNYFRSKEDLSVHYEKEFGKYNKDSKDQKELEQAYHRSANKVPPFFLKLTELYFKYLNLKPNLRRAFLERTEMLSGTWLSLPAGRQYWVAFALSTWFSLYLLWFVSAKFLNALALSVNAFTTLGFGYIPTEGISRYVLILEGLLGWLMMSIFSVTLIGQIIG